MKVNKLLYFTWISLSLLVTLACIISFFQTGWLVDQNVLYSFGISGFCEKSSASNIMGEKCGFYGDGSTGRKDFSNVLPVEWQFACIIYGSGCVLVTLGAICSVFTLCIVQCCNKSFISITKCVQGIAVVCLLTGLSLFPCGFNSPYVLEHCDHAAVFDPGTCHMGWTFTQATAATAVSVICMFVSIFFIKDVPLEEEVEILEQSQIYQADEIDIAPICHVHTVQEITISSLSLVHDGTEIK